MPKMTPDDWADSAAKVNSQAYNSDNPTDHKFAQIITDQANEEDRQNPR